MKEREKIALVTGSHGFIGNRLVGALEDVGWTVHRFPRTLWNQSLDKITAYIKERTITDIFHLASYGNHYGQSDPILIKTVNVGNTHKLLVAIEDYPLHSFVYTGSSSEYGTKDEPMKETMTENPTTDYGKAKRDATHICKEYAKTWSVPVIIARLFSVYGEHEASFRFIPTIIRCMREDKIMRISPGKHDWIYIDDVIYALLMLSANAQKKKGEIYNVGTGKDHSNLEVFKLMEKIRGKEIRHEISGIKRGYDTSVMWKANTEKIRSLGYFEPRPLADGLEEVYKALVPSYEQ